MEDASASSVCYNHYRYSSNETTYTHNRGILGDINESTGDLSVSDTNNDHAVLYVDDYSVPDSEVKYAGFGWLQAGYMLGTVDNVTATRTIVYGENNDKNVGSPVAHPYASLAGGNRLFTVMYTGITGYGGRGEYEAYYSLSYTWLATAYLKSPTATGQDATAEAVADNSSSACPVIVNGLIGTDGNETSPTWDSSTEVYIYDNDPSWVPFITSNVARSYEIDSPYHLYNYSQWDAFDAYGGP